MTLKPRQTTEERYQSIKKWWSDAAWPHNSIDDWRPGDINWLFDYIETLRQTIQQQSIEAT